VLFSLVLSVVETGVDDFIPQPTFSLSDVVDEGADLSAAPTTGGYGAPAGQGRLLAAVALKDGVGRMPLVDPAEGDFVGFVVRFDVLDNLGHSLALSRRLTGLGRPAKGSVVVTVTILAQMIGLVKIFTRKPQKIDEK
jgi:hypothetical protein